MTMKPLPRHLPHRTHEAMIRAAHRALSTGDEAEYMRLLKTPDGMKALTSQGMLRQTPLYAAMWRIATTGDGLTEANTPELAARLTTLLRATEASIGPDALDQAANMINFSHPMEQEGRYHAETLGDLLQENPVLAPHFTGVMQRFHLLSRADVITEQTSFVSRIDGDRDSGSLKPFG